MRMMFAVGSLNRARSKIVVAGRLRGSGIPAPPTPSHGPPAGPGEVARRRAGDPGADRIRGGAPGEGTDSSSRIEGRSRVH